jgi:hypothetical protein
MVWVLFFHASFLFAEGRGVLRDTLPEAGSIKQLPTVVLRRQPSLGSRSGDTLVFDAQRYARPTAFRLEELLKDVPGFRVDDEGRIYFNGKEISRIMIDGDDLSGERYRLLSRNLRSVMVGKIELIQQHQSNPLLKGFDLTGSSAINIKIKDEYKGRASGSGSLGMGTRKTLQLEFESVWLKDSLKQLIFLDQNNVGTHAINDQRENGGESNGRSSFDVHPFPFALPQQPISLSAGQSILNNDVAANSLSSFKTAAGVKVNLAATLGKYNVEQEQLINRLLLQKGGDLLKFLQRMGKQRRTAAASIRSGWENNKSANHLVKTFLQLDLDRSIQQHVEHRSGISNFAMDVQQQERLWRMQWDRESTRRLGKGSIFQHENRIAIGALSVITAITKKNESDSFMGLPSEEKFYRRGFLFADHLGMFSSRGNLKWKWGLRTSFEWAASSVVSDQMGYRQYKSYPYATFIWSPQKRFVFHTQAAAGFVLYGEQQLNLRSIHSIEQRLHWKFKRLLQVQLSSGVRKESGDVRDMLVGPFTTREGIVRQGNRQMTLPTSFHFSIAGSQVDLHAGRSWTVLLRYANHANEIGRAINMNRSSESWQPILLGSRQTWSFDLQGEQYLLFLRSKIRLHWNRSSSLFPQMVNGINNEMLLRVVSADLTIIHHSSRKSGFEIQYHHIYSHHHLVNKPSMKNDVVQKTVVSNFSWRIHAALYASLTFGQLLNGRNSMMDLSFLGDIGKQWKLSVTGQNLLNQSSYRVTTVDDLGITTLDQYLNGRRILLKVRYLF